MPWSPHLPQGQESEKIFPFVIPYAQGVGLDIGCGTAKCLPHMIGVDNGKTFGPRAAAIMTEADELGMIADESLDFIFSSHLLEHIPREKVPAVLALWGSKLKVGGKLILYLPDADEYPKIGEDGANPDHKWDIYADDVWKILQDEADGLWCRLESEKRNKYNEYSLFEVYKKDIEPFKNTVWQRNPDGKKRALVFRLGAIGDCLVAASPCAALQQNGYHVTMMTSPVGGVLFENNPHIDDVVVIDKENFPQGYAIAFFEAMKERYDKVINLDRTIEGAMLAREEQYSFEYPVSARRYLNDNLNYHELAHAIADVPIKDIGPGFFPTEEERDWALSGRHSIAAPLVVWAIAGSSFFKVYPSVNRVISRLIADGVNVVLVGDGQISHILEHGIIDTLYEDGVDTKLVYPRVGRWTIRETMAFAMTADCVIGPETGVMHGVGFSRVPKVILMSHSAPENLMRHWTNTIALMPAGCPCYPCHQIHTDVDTCNYDVENGGALCTTSISPDRVYKSIKISLERREKIIDS